MNVISRRKLREFYLATPERKRHAAAFENWFRLARRARWQSFQDTRATFGQTDVATGDSGRTATIFDIGGNKYRVVAHVDYLRQTVLIRRSWITRSTIAAAGRSCFDRRTRCSEPGQKQRS